jgi:RHS repeat-associated protein
MLSHRKSKHAKLAGGLIPQQKNRLKLAAALWVTVAFAFLVAFSASAKNAPLQEMAAKEAADRFEQQMKGYGESPSVKMARAAVASLPEPMPDKAKPAKNRKEAEAVIRPLVSSNSSITYDPFGRMVGIIDPGPVTRQFVYSGDKLCEERDGTGAVTKQFFQWGEIISGTKYFYNRDQLGSITEMTDSSGNIVAQYRYDPFGNVTRIAGSGPDSDFLYAGYFYHQPSGLYITAHRAYNPKLGRWLNRDPIDDATFARMPRSPEPADPDSMMPMNPVAAALAPMMQTTHDPMLRKKLARLIPHVPGTRMPESNPYTYCENNPISSKDPSGLMCHPSDPYNDCFRCCEQNKANDEEDCDKNYKKGTPEWEQCMQAALATYRACVESCKEDPDSCQPNK